MNHKRIVEDIVSDVNQKELSKNRFFGGLKSDMGYIPTSGIRYRTKNGIGNRAKKKIQIQTLNRK